MSKFSDFLVWGNNQSNLLSKSSTKCLSSPVPLSLPFQVVSICASEKHISILTKQGQLYSYGSNLDGRLGVSTRSVDKVSYTEPIKIELDSKILRSESGFSHMCVLTQNYQLFSWGLGDYGALGTGQFKSKSTPTKVDLPKQLVKKLRQISCGAMHTAFLFEDGDVYSCGSNQYGQLGVNRPEKVSTPIPISFHIPVIQISCGVFYTLLLTKQGRVYGMGNNKYGQLGTGHKVNQCHPTLIKQLNDIVKVTAGYHSGAIDKFGNLYIWGSGSFGELLRPKKFVLSVPIKDIAIRGFFGVAIGHTSKNQNRIYSWGNNTFGQLGVGNYEASKQPQQIQTLRGLQINKIALGVNFAMILMNSSTEIFKKSSKEQVSQFRSKYSNNQKQQTPQVGISQTKSIIGFQQKYLNSNKKRNQELYSGYTKTRENLFQPIKSINKKIDDPYSYRQRGLRKGQYDKRQQRSHSLIQKQRKQNQGSYKRVTFDDQIQRHIHQDLSQKKNYQNLFVELSKDYEVLVKRYNELQRQISLTQNNQVNSLRNMQNRQKELLNENIALKNQISKLSYDLIVVNDEARAQNRKIQQLVHQNQMIHAQHAKLSQITLSPRRVDNSLSAEIQKQYNKLLTQKQQIITKLNLSLSKADEQYKISTNRLNQQNIKLRNELSLQVESNRKIVKQHQSLLDQLQHQIKKSQQVCHILREQNEQLRNQNNFLKKKSVDLQNTKNKFEQIQTNEKWLKEKYEQDIRQSQVKGEALTSRIAQLQIQLDYQKQFNKKYQESILQIKQNNDRLYKEVNLQIQNNQQKFNKIQALKAEVDRYKKYKKDLDEKNIQLEQFSQNFEIFKRKNKQIIQQKQKQLKNQEQAFQKNLKQCYSNLQRKCLQIEDLNKQIIRLQKQIIKGKQNISALKGQIEMKDNQIEHLSQQRINLQKKVAILSTQLNKEVQQRQSLVKDSGQSKRQVVRLKISNGELENKLQSQKEQRAKACKALILKQQQIAKLQQELQKANQKCQNFKKQNNHYRQQIQQISYQLQNQTKINEQLSKANKEFAESQSQFLEKISELQNKIYELQDQNKSYTPRYEALLIRNRQLDDRNRQLGQMINKAIQIQAESYKNNILKEVEINTDNIISQFKEEQQFQIKGRRNKNKSKQIQKSMVEQQANLTQRGQKSSLMKQQPYTKMMKQRITQHKKKVSQSAQKLASLLEMNEKGKFSKTTSQIRHNTEDYQKINSQMQSFNNQKQQFMSKINSFAEKLKII